MAQVLLDQEQNQHRLKRSIFEIANRLITSDVENDRKSRKKQSKLAVLEKTYPISDEESVDSPDFEDDDEPNSDTDTLSNAIHHSKAKSRGFPCTICGHVASSTERLKEHLSRHTGKKHLECDVCGKKFAWRYSFRSHVASHSKDNPNKCSICGKKYCNKSSVKNHMLRVHGNPKREFKCDKCEKTFVTKSELERHKYNHTNEKPFMCEYCGNAYRFKAALVVHYRVHSGDKPYKCAFCDKAFIHLSSAIGHRRRHTGEMPYQCKECGKLFRVKRALTAHMVVHSDKQAYKCDKCEKSFKSRSGFRVHLDFHLDIKRHHCKYCDRSFRAWCNMHKHMKRHLNEKLNKCETCDRTFIEKQELISHMKGHNDKKCPKTIRNSDLVSNTCEQIMPPQNLCAAPNMRDQPIFTENPHPDEIIPSNMDISDSQGVLYDCNLLNSMDKCQTEKCQLLQDSYISQFLYPQHSSLQYASPSVLSMYSNDGGLVSNRSCLSNLNTPNYNYMSANNQNYSGFSYNISTTDTLLSKCKLCRSLFHSSIFLRTHLLDYHRIEEDAIDEFMS